MLRSLLALLLFVPLFLAASGVEAHGKQVNIAVSSLAPDPARPLVRLYRARITYDDGDPAGNLQVLLTAVRREDGVTAGTFLFTELSQPGVYVTEVAYPRFGAWSVALRVQGAGEGETTFVEEVLPAAASPARLGSGPPDGIRQKELLLSFDVQDGLNIGARIVHSLSAAVWFGLAALVVASHWFVPVEARGHLLSRIARVFPTGAAVSLGLLLLSGIYNAIYNAPNRVPGLLAPVALARLPFGDAYIAAFYLKVLLFLLSAAITLVLAFRLRRLARQDGQPAPRSFHWLALSNTVLGLLVFVDVSVLVYLHYISHLGLFAG